MSPSTAAPFMTRSGTLLVLVTLSVLATVVFLRNFPGPSHPVPKDFAQYYVTGMALVRGEADALYHTDLQTGLTTRRFPESRFGKLAAEVGIVDTSFYIYPPWVGILYAPLTLVSPYRALVVVYLLNWVLTILTFVVLARAVPGWGFPAAAASFALLLLTRPFLQAIGAGQASIPVMLLLALTGRAMWTRRDVEAGIWLALITGMKLFPVLFIPYLLVLRRWRTLLAFAVGGVAVLAVSLGSAGWDAHVRFLDIILDYSRTSTPLVSNQSITGFLLRLGDGGDIRHWSIVTVPPVVFWAARAATLAWLALTLWLVERLRRHGGEWWEPLAFSLAALWVFSGAANVWLHHLLALAIPAVVTAAYVGTRLEGRGGPALWLWGAAWAGVILLDGFYRLPDGMNGLVVRLSASFPFLGALAMVLLTVLLARYELRRPRA